METAMIYLKTPLFALKGNDDPIPTGALVLEGHIQEHGKGGVLAHVYSYFAVEGKNPSRQTLKKREGDEAVLFIPTSKIDHIRFQETEDE